MKHKKIFETKTLEKRRGAHITEPLSARGRKPNADGRHQTLRERRRANGVHPGAAVAARAKAVALEKAPAKAVVERRSAEEALRFRLKIKVIQNDLLKITLYANYKKFPKAFTNIFH